MNLDQVLADIETQLLEFLPQRLAGPNGQEPWCALFLVYRDTWTPEHPLSVVLVRASARDELIERKGVVEASTGFWDPHAHGGSAAAYDDLDNADIQAQIERAYDVMTATDEEDEVQLLPFRQMLWRVAAGLSERDWTGILPVTDDFVAVALNSNYQWSAEDLKQSIPPAKMKLLKKRRLFFHKPTPAERAAEKEAQERALAGLSSRPQAEQVGYWISEIEKLVRGEPGILKAMKWTEKEALEQLKAIGAPAVMPLIDLFERLDAMPHTVEKRLPKGVVDDLSRSAAALGPVGKAIGQIGHADAAVERRLRDLLAATCRANVEAVKKQPKDRWGFDARWNQTPYRIGHILHAAFPKHRPYEWPVSDGQNRLKDWEQWLAAPYFHQPS